MNRFRPNMQVASSVPVSQTKTMRGLWFHLDASNKDSLTFSDGTVGTDANGVITGSVVTWANLANQNQRAKGTQNRSVNPTTHVSAEMPTYSASVAQCNNNPALYFDETDGLIVTRPGMVDETENPLRYGMYSHEHQNAEWQIFLAIYMDSSAGSNATVYHKSDGEQILRKNSSYSDMRTLNAGLHANLSGVSEDQFDLFDINVTDVGSDDLQLSVVVNGTEIESKTLTNAMTVGWPDGTGVQNYNYPSFFVIGAQYSGDSTGGGVKEEFKGYMCEFLWFDRAFTTAERTTMREHLTTKWGAFG